MEPYYRQNVTYNLDEPNFQLGAQVVDALGVYKITSTWSNLPSGRPNTLLK